MISMLLDKLTFLYIFSKNNISIEYYIDLMYDGSKYFYKKKGVYMFLNFKVQLSIYLISLSMTLFVSLLLFIKGKKTPLLYSFVTFQIFIMIWIIRIILIKISILTNINLIGNLRGFSFELYELTHFKLSFIIKFMMSLIWLVFCLIYSQVYREKDKLKYSLFI